MSYKYFYHVRVEQCGLRTPSFLEQLRNEPMTSRFYYDMLRWHLLDVCPWRNEYPAGLPLWVRCTVFRVVGNFEDFPEPRIDEEDMTVVATVLWSRDALTGEVTKYWSARKQDGSITSCI